MKFSSKRPDSIKTLFQCIEEVNGYLYLVEMNLLLSQIEREGRMELFFENSMHSSSDPENQVKH